MNGPRVTVPVEPTEAMIEAGNRALSPWIAPAMHAAEAYRAMLSAAPAPEGGAALDALDEALIYIENLGANIERNDLDMHLDTVERPFSFAQTMRGRFPSLCTALATREEAPAEAGSFEERAIALVKKHGDPNGSDYEQGQNDMGHRMVTMAREADAALRAQPPAREGGVK